MAEITTRMPNLKRKVLNGDQASHAMSFSKRMTTLKKKANELQILCDVKICMICFGPDGTVQTWPEGAVEVKDAIMSYRGLDAGKKHGSSLLGYLQDKKKKLELKTRKMMKKKVKKCIVNLSDQIDGLSEDAFRDTVYTLESKLFDLKEKIKLLSMQNDKGNRIQVHIDKELEMDGSSLPSSAAGASASLAWSAEVMETNSKVVETVGNDDKDAASNNFEMPPLPIDLCNWMENDEAYQHGFEIDDWFNE